MLRAIAIDDERSALDLLVKKLKKNCPDVQLIDTCLSGAEGVKSIHTHRPDVIFLDIDMPGLSGFEMLEMIKDIDFEVIFTTAFEKYAIKAFQISAIHFLLKPVDKKELIEAVKRVEDHRATRLFKAHYDVLTYNLQVNNINKKIVFASQQGYDLIASEDILYCEADGNYTTIYLINDSKKVYIRSLTSVEKLLESYNFFRIHQSFLINISHVKTYIKKDGGSVLITNGKELSVSRFRKEDLLKLIL